MTLPSVHSYTIPSQSNGQDSALFEEEVEIAPGIYLTKRQSEATSAPTANSQATGKEIDITAQLVLGNSSLEEQLDFLESEKSRLQNSVRHLLQTNDELRSADPDDPDFVQAIKENVAVLDKQMKLIRKYEEKIAQLVPHARPVPSTAATSVANDSTGVEGHDTDMGVYL